MLITCGHREMMEQLNGDHTGVNSPCPAHQTIDTHCFALHKGARSGMPYVYGMDGNQVIYQQNVCVANSHS